MWLLPRIRRLSAEQVTAALRAPALEVAPGSAEAASEHVLMLLPRLRLVRKQRLSRAAGKYTSVAAQK